MSHTTLSQQKFKRYEEMLLLDVIINNKR